MQQFLSTETLIIELLLIASIVAIIVRRLNIPYTVALVVVGLLITTQSSLKFELTPELILALFVPPLIFEASFQLNLKEFRNSAAPILILAVPGVILSTMIVGGIISFGTGLSLPIAMLFGSLVAATDPVAVISLFRLLGIPKRLAVLVEGESLLNDGTALVLFNMMLSVVLTNQFHLGETAISFVIISLGGVTIGLVLGWVISRLIARIDDYLIEITLTTVLAYGSYLLAEQLHFSGVLAVVAAGLITGSLGPQGMSPTTRIVVNNFWEYITFLVNSLVFLLIGLQVDVAALFAARLHILWAIGAVLVARVVVVYGLSWLTNRLAEPISVRWRHIIAWGGLRGALSLAMALSIPAGVGPERENLLTMAFGVALFTLLVQAPSMQALVHRLGIITTSPHEVDYAQRHARLNALRSAESYIERRYHEGLISAPAWEYIKPKMEQQKALLADAVHQILVNQPELATEELDLARREILRAQRSAYLGMRRDGYISEGIFETLSAEIDAAMDNNNNTEPQWFVAQESLPKRLNKNISDKTSVEDILIEEGSFCDGKKVKNIPWANHFVIVSLRRNNQIIIPKGKMVLQGNDLLTIVGDPESITKARSLCNLQAENHSPS